MIGLPKIPGHVEISKRPYSTEKTAMSRHKCKCMPYSKTRRYLKTTQNIVLNCECLSECRWNLHLVQEHSFGDNPTYDMFQRFLVLRNLILYHRIQDCIGRSCPRHNLALCPFDRNLRHSSRMRIIQTMSLKMKSNSNCNDFQKLSVNDCKSPISAVGNSGFHS